MIATGNENAPLYLHSAVYRTGENRLRVADVPGYAAIIKRRNIHFLANAANSYFFTTSDIYKIASAAIAQTLSRSGQDGSHIDLVVFCSSHFADPFPERNNKLAALLAQNGLAPQRVIGVSGTGCVDLLQGIEIASRFLDDSAWNTALIIGLEVTRKTDLFSRLIEYALISDAAVSLILSRAPGHSSAANPWRILAQEGTSLISKVGRKMDIDDIQAYARCIDVTLEAGKIRKEQVTKILGNNIFPLIKELREIRTGFQKHQIYLHNSEALGHCLSCDTIINLIDHTESPEANYYLLFAEAEGHASAIALHRAAQG